MSHEKNLRLAKRHGMKVLCYRDLSVEYQAAIAYYMAIDGSAWELPEGIVVEADIRLTQSKQHRYGIGKFYGKLLPKYLDFFVKKFGGMKFGVVNIPMSVCKAEVMKRDKDMAEDHKDFETYHKWYKRDCGIPRHKHTNPWPCILSGFNDEVFEDGWHRFHRYVQLGLDSVPCVIYI